MKPTYSIFNCIYVRAIYSSIFQHLMKLTCVFLIKINNFGQCKMSEFSLITCFLLLMQLLVVHGVADDFVVR